MTVTGKIRYKVGPISFGDYVHAFFSQGNVAGLLRIKKERKKGEK